MLLFVIWWILSTPLPNIWYTWLSCWAKSIKFLGYFLNINKDTLIRIHVWVQNDLSHFVTIWVFVAHWTKLRVVAIDMSKKQSSVRRLFRKLLFCRFFADPRRSKKHCRFIEVVRFLTKSSRNSWQGALVLSFPEWLLSPRKEGERWKTYLIWFYNT